MNSGRKDVDQVRGLLPKVGLILLETALAGMPDDPRPDPGITRRRMERSLIAVVRERGADGVTRVAALGGLLCLGAASSFWAASFLVRDFADRESLKAEQAKEALWGDLVDDRIVQFACRVLRLHVFDDLPGGAAPADEDLRDPLNFSRMTAKQIDRYWASLEAVTAGDPPLGTHVDGHHHDAELLVELADFVDEQEQKGSRQLPRRAPAPSPIMPSSTTPSSIMPSWPDDFSVTPAPMPPSPAMPSCPDSSATTPSAPVPPSPAMPKPTSTMPSVTTPTPSSPPSAGSAPISSASPPRSSTTTADGSQSLPTQEEPTAARERIVLDRLRAAHGARVNGLTLDAELKKNGHSPGARSVIKRLREKGWDIECGNATEKGYRLRTASHS